MNATTTISIIVAAIVFISIVAGLVYAANKIHRRSFIVDDEQAPEQNTVKQAPCPECLYSKSSCFHEPCKSCSTIDWNHFKKRTPPPELRPEPETGTPFDEPLPAGPDILKSWEPELTVCDHCNNGFYPKWPRQKRFCSPECAEKHRLQEVARKKLQPHNPPKRPGTMPVG